MSRHPSPEAIRERAEELVERGKKNLGFVHRSDWLAGALYDHPDVRTDILVEAERQLRAEASAREDEPRPGGRPPLNADETRRQYLAAAASVWRTGQVPNDELIGQLLSPRREAETVRAWRRRFKLPPPSGTAPR